MKFKWLIAIAAVLIIITAALSLKTEKEVTTSSTDAYNYFIAGKTAAERLYNDEALENFEAAVRADSSFAFAWALLSNFYYVTGRYEEGKDAAKRAYKLSLNLPEKERLSITLQTAELRGNMAEFEATLELMLELYPKEVEPHYYYAHRLWKTGKLQDAVAEFETVLKINPNYALAYNNLGYLHAQIGDYNKAVEYLKKYVFIAPDQANPHDSLGEIYLMIGRYDEAIELFHRAFAVKPSLTVEPGNLASAIHLHLAKAYAAKGYLKKAYETLDKTLELAPGDYYRQHALVEKARIQARQKEYNQAIATLEQASEVYSHSNDLSGVLGAKYCEMRMPDKIAELIRGNKELMDQTLRKCLGDSANIVDQVDMDLRREYPSVDHVYRIGRFLDIYYKRAAGQYAEALDALNRFKDEIIYSDTRIVLEYNEAKTLMDMQRYTEALIPIESLLQVNPNTSSVQLLKARALAESAQTAEAISTLKLFISRTYDADSDWVPRLEAMEMLKELEEETAELSYQPDM